MGDKLRLTKYDLHTMGSANLGLFLFTPSLYLALLLADGCRLRLLVEKKRYGNCDTLVLARAVILWCMYSHLLSSPPSAHGTMI